MDKTLVREQQLERLARQCFVSLQVPLFLSACEFVSENICLQDENDWDIVLGAVNILSLDKFSLINCKRCDPQVAASKNKSFGEQRIMGQRLIEAEGNDSETPERRV